MYLPTVHYSSSSDNSTIFLILNYYVEFIYCRIGAHLFELDDRGAGFGWLGDSRYR